MRILLKNHKTGQLTSYEDFDLIIDWEDEDRSLLTYDLADVLDANVDYTFLEAAE